MGIPAPPPPQIRPGAVGLVPGYASLPYSIPLTLHSVPPSAPSTSLMQRKTFGFCLRFKGLTLRCLKF